MADITLIIPNRTHAFPINIKGTVTSNENSGTDILVFVGSQKATPVEEITGPLQFKISVEATNMFAGEITKDEENKKFVMGEIDGSSIGITDDLIVVSDINSDNAADFKNVPSTKGQLQFTATISDADGVEHTKVQTCDYVKARSLFSTDTNFIEVGTTLRSSTESIMDPEGIKQVISFNWYRDTAPIEGATNYTYVITNEDVNNEISAIFKYIDGKDNEKEVIAIQNVFVVDSAPINFPIISGIPESGRTLTADTSFIFDRNEIVTDYSYEWTLGGNVTSVTGSSFEIQQGDIDAGKSLVVSVKYTDGAGIENILNSPSVTIRDSAAGDTVQVVGLPKIGQNLQASISTEDGTTPTILGYEWRRGGKIIEGAETDTYRIKRADINSFLTVTIQYDAGSGISKYKTSGIISFENSVVNGLPILSKVLEDGTTSSDLGGAASVGTEMYADVSGITDPDDIKDFYYSFDQFEDSDLQRDKIEQNSTIGHKTIVTKRSSVNQSFVESSDQINYDEAIEVQSVFVDNSLGNTGDTIFIQYKDTNGAWQNALEVAGKQRKFFLLDENISSANWRMSFIASSSDETASTYSFEARWALESPSILSTRKFIYQWQRTVNGAKEEIIGARKQTYLLSQNDLNSSVNVKVSFIDGANEIVTLESNSIEIQNYAPTGKVKIEGTAKVGYFLTAKSELKDRDNITTENTEGTVETIDAYQWYLDGVAISGATSQTLLLTEEMEAKTVSVEATYTDLLNATHTVRSRTNRRINAAPKGGVSISGTPKVGQVLSIVVGKLKDLNQFNNLFYQWFLVDGDTEEAINNAALQSYTVKTTDIGKAIRANVFYTDNDGFQETVSTNTISILDSETTGEPSIDGIPLAGNTVTANIANISDENGIQGYAYQWRIDGVDVDGATFNTFTISPDQDGNYGNYLTVAVTVTDNAQNQKTIHSDPVRIALAAGTIGSDGGTITGDNVSITLQSGSLQQDTIIYVYETNTGEEPELPEGSTLVGTAWAFTPHGTTFSEPITIQFDVPEGTNLVLRADNEDDNSFEIVENYSVENTTATLETNTFSVYVGSVFTPAVITGTPQQGNYLTASVAGDITDVSFQWKRNGSNILNAQNDVYLVSQDDVGQKLTVAATFTDANGASTTKTSAETEILNTPAQGEIKIDGSRRVGITLETRIVSLIDINTVNTGSYTYQWFRNSVAIQDATNSTYEVVEADFLKDLTVKVSFNDEAGNTETVESEEAFVSKKGSVFFTTNSRKQGDTLSVDTSTLNDFYSMFNRNFSWYLDNNIAYSGENLTRRTLTTADSGKTLKTVFTYTDGRGTVETLETDERFIYTISDTITPAGGTITGNGITINVPAGAVSENKDILVYVVPYTEDQLPIGTLSDEVAYAFTPLDLTFDQPITITLPKPNDEYDMILHGANSSVDEFVMTEDDYLTIENTNQVTIQTDNFGVFMSAILYVRVDIIGTPEQGQLLDTVFTGEVFSKTYQWYRGDVPLEGETGTTYTVTLDDVGEELKVISTYLLESGSSPETVESEPILILNSQPEVDTSSIISGEDRVGQILTADPSGITDDNNPDGLNIADFLYQWKVEGEDISGETSENLTIRSEHFNKNITVEITYVDAAGLLESVTSDQFYITRIPPSGYVEVIGTPEVDEYLEVDTDNLVDLNGIGEFSYQWHADGVDLVGETSAALLVTSAMEDKAISVTLTYTDGVGEIETVTSRNAPVIDADPVGNVVIDYTILEVAQTLVANTSAITDANSPGGVTGFTYQWKSNGADISGATSKNYVIANQFCNTNITVTVTYTDGDGYIESLTSEPVLIVNSPVQGFPTVSGTPGVSETLTINTNNLSDVNVLGDFNYKWFADGVEIAGATEKTWVVAANSYVGKEITGQVYYVDGAGNNEEVNTSNGLTIQNSPPVGKPVVDGTFQVGQTLTVYTNEIEDFNVIATPFSFQWYADNVAIANETGSNYVIQVSDINKYISVDASYTDEGNTLETVRSLEHLVVNTPGTATVLITNTGLEQGDILSSSVTSQDDNIRVSDYSYQWKRDGIAIRNANEPTYMLGRNDWDKDITLQVSFTDTGGFVETFQSENSASMVNSLPTGDIIITGSDKVGEIVEIDVSQIADANEIKDEFEVYRANSVWGGYLQINFQEPTDITKIEGISRIYTGAIHPNGSYITELLFTVSSSSGLTDVSIDDLQHSLNIGTETNSMRLFTTELNHAITAVTKVTLRYAGSGYYGIVLTGINKDSENYTYQWYRDGQMLSGSTEKTYTTTFDDLYKTLTVDVSYTDFHGNVEIPNNTASFDIVNSPPEGTVLIAGTRNVGEELYFTHNVVDRDNVTVDNPTGLVTFSSYQWYRSDFEDGELTLINDATGSTLLLTPELQAKWIALDATYVDIEGDDDTIHASNRLPVKSTPTGNAIITSADLQLGRQVFLDTSTIADLNDLGEFSYQWYRTEGTGSIAISGAVQTHYSFQPDDLGENIYCVVSYVDGDGDQEHVTSNNLGPVVQTNGSVGTVSVTDRVEIGGTIESDLENIFAMNNFETVAPVVAYNFHSDTRDVSPNGLHLAGTNYSFDDEGGLDLSHSTSAYLRTSGTTPVLNNDTHTIAFRVKIKNTSSYWTKILSFGRSTVNDGNPEIYLQQNSTRLEIDYVPETSGLITSDLGTDTWHDIVFVKQGSVCRVYVDGSLENEYTGLPNPKSTGNYLLEFGYKDSNHRAAPVIIKDFQIFDFAVDDYTSVANYPFYTEPTLSLQWKADGNPIAGATGSVYQVPENNTELGKDITLEVSLTDALGNARALESGVSTVVGSDLVQVEKFLLEDGSEMLQEDGSSFLSETTTENISLPLSINGDSSQTILSVDDIISVDVSSVVDPNGLAGVEYQWLANNTPIAGATSSSYAITADETNKDIRVKAVFEDGMGRKSARLSDEITVMNTAITGTIQVSSTGEYKVGNALLANSIDISDDNGIMSVSPTYQWYRDGSAISGEIGRPYIIKNADVGAQLHVVASIVDNYFNIETITSDTVSILDSTGIGSATINGLPKVGATLAIDTSGLSDPNGITSFSYQWRRGVNDLSGETNQTYTVIPSDYGQDITAVVTYVDGAGNVTTLSNLPVIHIVRAAALGSVTITGTAEVLSTLTATDTITDQDLMGPKNYQWYLNGSAISGATSSTFEIPRGYEGQDIHVVLSYVETLEDGSNDVETMVSNIVQVNSKPYGTVTVTGTAKKGQTLSIDMSEVIDTNIIDNTTKTYQWQREVSNGVFQNISGATSSTYVPVNDDVENKIRVVVSYTDEAGFNESINSVPVLVENSLPTGVISFSGTRKTGNTIAATISNISDLNGIATIPEYQWKLDGEILVGETGNSYTIIADDVGKELSLQLTYTDSVGIVEVEEQSAGIIQDSETTGQVDITGNFVLNGTVTADISSIADTDGIDTISYQWKALDVEIPGATSQTYVLNDSDMRRFNISVEVSVLDVNGTIKTFSKKKWFDEGAMVATYKWYHFDDLNHILNFQADDQLVTNNLQLHLDANSADNFDGSTWLDMSENGLQAVLKNDFSIETANGSIGSISSNRIQQDISENDYIVHTYNFVAPEDAVISGEITVNLSAYYDYYRQYRTRSCTGGYYVPTCCGYYCYNSIYSTRYDKYCCYTEAYICGYECRGWSYGSWQYTNTSNNRLDTRTNGSGWLVFELIAPNDEVFVITSSNLTSASQDFQVNVGRIKANGVWKVRFKATTYWFDHSETFHYSNDQGYQTYTRYLDSNISSFNYEVADEENGTYVEQGIVSGIDEQNGHVEAITSVSGEHKAIRPLEQITLETFVYRDSTSSFHIDEYLVSKQGYKMYVDDDDILHVVINNTRTASWNLNNAPALANNAWHHIAATFDGYSIKIYLDGDLKTSTDPLVQRLEIQTSTDDLFVGSENNLFTMWSGKIASFKLYDRALTRKEILSNYNYELNRNGLTEKTFSLQPLETYLVTNGKSGAFNTSISTEYTKELRGYFKPLQSGDHTFYVYGADKGYFWVGDKAKERISTSNADIETTSSGEFSYTIYLEADTAYPIRFISGNSYEDSVTSTSRLSVQGPGLGKTTNLQNYLFGGDAAWTYWDTAVAKVTYMVEDFDSQWDDISAYDFTGFSDYQTIISNFGLNVNRTLSEPYRWDALPKPEFSDNIETSLEESFEDTSWTGPNRFDWTGVENPEQVASQFGINGYTSFGDNEERFKWTDAPTATFSGDSLVEETFEDDSWTGFTRVDWTGVDPADYRSGIQGYWEGTHDWTSEPQPQFQQDTFVFSEEFEDTSWTGYTRFDWTGTENPSSVVSGKGFAAHWEGQFKWSERAQTSFSEKSLLLEESFEEDWTI